MEDYAAFCRQRLRACFHRRRKYALGSADRDHAVKEARAFLRAYRAEIGAPHAGEQSANRSEPAPIHS